MPLIIRRRTGQVRMGAVDYEDCSICNNTRWVGTIEKPVRCKCNIRYEVRRRLPIALAPYLDDDYLQATLADGHLHEVRTENVLLTGSWDRIAPYIVNGLFNQLKGLISTAERWPVVVLTDQELLDLTFEKDEDGSSRLKSVTAPECCELLILRLGFVGSKNLEAPNALAKALQYRQGVKATWVIIDPDVPFQEGRAWSWSALVDQYLRQWSTADFEEPVPDLAHQLMEDCS